MIGKPLTQYLPDEEETTDGMGPVESPSEFMRLVADLKAQKLEDASAQPVVPVGKTDLPSIPSEALKPISKPAPKGYGPELDDAALKVAQARADRITHRALLSRAGSGIAAAMGGYNEDDSFAKALAETGKTGVTNILQRRAGLDQGMEFEKKQADNDPGSDSSKQARALAVQAIPGLAKQPGFESQSRAQIAENYPFMEKILAAGEKRSEVERKVTAEKEAADRGRDSIEGLYPQEVSEFKRANPGTFERLSKNELDDVQKAIEAKLGRVATKDNAKLTADRAYDAVTRATLTKDQRDAAEKADALKEGVPDGWTVKPGKNPSKKDREDFTKAVVIRDQINPEIAELQTLIKRSNTAERLLPSETKNRINALVKSIAFHGGQIEGLNRYTGAEFHAFDTGILTAPTGLDAAYADRALSQLELLKKGLNGNITAQANAIGLSQPGAREAAHATTRGPGRVVKSGPHKGETAYQNADGDWEVP